MALARPGRRVVACLGDGALLFGAQGLWALAHCRLPGLIVIFNNRGYVSTKTRIHALQGLAARQKVYFGSHIDDPPVDFALLRTHPLHRRARSPAWRPTAAGAERRLRVDRAMKRCSLGVSFSGVPGPADHVIRSGADRAMGWRRGGATMAEDEKPQNVRNILVIAAADQSEVGSQGQVQTFVPPRLAKLHTELVKLRQQNRLSQAMPMSQAVWGQVGPVVKEVEKAISQWRVRPELQRRNKLDEDLGKLRTLDADLGKLRKPGQQTVLSQESQDKLAQGLVPVKGLLDELIGHSAQTRALLKVTGDKLLELADNAYSFTFDLLEAPPGPTGYHMDLQCALLNSELR